MVQGSYLLLPAVGSKTRGGGVMDTERPVQEKLIGKDWRVWYFSAIRRSPACSVVWEKKVEIFHDS